VHIQFWFKSVKERDHSEDLCRYEKITLKCINSEGAYELDSFESE
jgi:hypothetical protein